MKQFKYYLMADFCLLPQLAQDFSSCSDNDDEESTVNPAVDVVTRTKQHEHSHFALYFLAVPINESLSVS